MRHLLGKPQKEGGKSIFIYLAPPNINHMFLKIRNCPVTHYEVVTVVLPPPRLAAEVISMQACM